MSEVTCACFPLCQSTILTSPRKGGPTADRWDVVGWRKNSPWGRGGCWMGQKGWRGCLESQLVMTLGDGTQGPLSPRRSPPAGVTPLQGAPPLASASQPLWKLPMVLGTHRAPPEVQDLSEGLLETDSLIIVSTDPGSAPAAGLFETTDTNQGSWPHRTFSPVRRMLVATTHATWALYCE